MKRITYNSLLFLIGILVFALSCTDLEEEVHTELIGESLFENPAPNDVVAILGGVYSGIKPLYGSWTGGLYLHEECADVMVTPGRIHGWIDAGEFQNQHRHTWTSDHRHSNAAWINSYSGILAANEAIYQISTGGLPLQGDAKAMALAEMKTLRAFYFYYLCDVFGNVPIDTIFPPPEDHLPTQNTRQDVYDFIESEVLSSIDNLDRRTGLVVYGKFSKWAAHTLLAKLYLNAEIYTGTAQWAKCITHCDSVIEHGGYALADDYSDNFVVHNEYSPEIIFPVTFSSEFDDDGGWNFIYLKTLHGSLQATYQLENEPWNGMCGIPQFIDTYHPNDLRMDKTWISGQQYGPNGDSLFCNLSTANAGIPLNFVNFVDNATLAREWQGLRIGKYEIEVGGLRHAENDYPIWRYADILLMKAECLLRTGNSNEAATLVTEVRSRAFADQADAVVTGTELEEGSSYNYGVVTMGIVTDPEGGDDILYGRLLDERGWELAFEAHRRQDLIRFGVFTTKSWLSHTPNGHYRTIYPIPFEQINNNPNLTQNPGY